MKVRQTPTVYCIVLNHNGAAVLRNCLESVLASGYPSLHVLVVDNASVDGSEKMVESFGDDVTLLQNETNLGFGAGMNVGIRHALEQGADYVLLFNNDAVMQPETISRMVEVWEANPSYGLLSPAIVSPDGSYWFRDGKIDWLRMRAVHIHTTQYVVKPPVHNISNEVIDTKYVSGCSMMLRADVIQKVGFFDEKYFLYYEDVDYSLRVRDAGYLCGVVPDAEVVHHEQVSALSPQKTYYLVYSGLLFFSDHARGLYRLYIPFYTRLRRLKNWIDCVVRPTDVAKSVRRAYREFYAQKK